jgi:5-methyltetrahydrofolate--homocysteine methyltransferase
VISLQSVRAIRRELPDVRTVISLSAVSFGLPFRSLLNRCLLPLLIESGIGAVFLDPTDRRLMSALAGTRALLGQDPHGLDYITAHRSGFLEAR